MIHATITTNAQKKEVNIPQNWGECPWPVAKEILTAGGTVETAAAIVTGIPFEVIGRSMKVQDVDALLGLLGWASEPPFMAKFARPESIRIDGKEYPLPDDLGDMTYAFHIDTDATCKEIDPEKPETLLKAYEEIAAGFLQELRDGAYNLTEATKFRSYIDSLTFGHVAGIANFFLRKKLGYWIGASATAGLTS